MQAVQIQIWTGDFNEKVGDAIAVAKRRSPRAGRALFLLDQYGWSSVSFAAVRRILAELASPEIFMTFSVDALIDYLSDRSFELDGFSKIDVDSGLIRELLSIKQADQGGYRAVIQNTLYKHVQTSTSAPFYSPFFIKSPEAHRSYWFIHLSKHREARNEIGRIHWSESNASVHHGRPGLGALGFTPDSDLDQLSMGFAFDEHARAASKSAVSAQLPQLIFDAVRAHGRPSLEELFASRCNDTPVVRDILEESLVLLRDAGEIAVVSVDGRPRPRASRIDWSDTVQLARQRTLFGPFSKLTR